MNRSSKILLTIIVILIISVIGYEILFWFGTPPTVDRQDDSTVETITVNDHEIAYTVQGEGPAIMLLHSGAWSSIEYRFIAEQLDNAYTVYLVDLPGFGYSEKPQVRYTVEYLEDQMNGFIEQFPREHFHVVGTSIGGTLATLLASAHPERVRSVTLINPVGFGSEINQASVFMQVPVLAEVLLSPNMLIFNYILDNGLLNADTISEQYRKELYELSKLPKAQRAKLSVLRDTLTLQGVDPELTEQLESAAATMRVPVLFIWSSSDTYTPVTQLTEAIQMFPSTTQWHVLDNIGHFAHMEAPDEVTSILMPFLQDPSIQRTPKDQLWYGGIYEE